MMISPLIVIVVTSENKLLSLSPHSDTDWQAKAGVGSDNQKWKTSVMVTVTSSELRKRFVNIINILVVAVISSS